MGSVSRASDSLVALMPSRALLFLSDFPQILRVRRDGGIDGCIATQTTKEKSPPRNEPLLVSRCAKPDKEAE